MFWSITLYGEPSKYLVPNPIGRFKINTYDLQDGSVEKNPDGSLDIFISADESEEELAAGAENGRAFFTGTACVYAGRTNHSGRMGTAGPGTHLRGGNCNV